MWYFFFQSKILPSSLRTRLLGSYPPQKFLNFWSCCCRQLFYPSVHSLLFEKEEKGVPFDHVCARMKDITTLRMGKPIDTIENDVRGFKQYNIKNMFIETHTLNARDLV